jgi:hypothetical protein
MKFGNQPIRKDSVGPLCWAQISNAMVRLPLYPWNIVEYAIANFVELDLVCLFERNRGTDDPVQCRRINALSAIWRHIIGSPVVVDQ